MVKKQSLTILYIWLNNYIRTIDDGKCKLKRWEERKKAIEKAIKELENRNNKK